MMSDYLLESNFVQAILNAHSIQLDLTPRDFFDLSGRQFLLIGYIAGITNHQILDQISCLNRKNFVYFATGVHYAVNQTK